MRVPQLHTIPISHFCERSRWTLDALNIVYEEVASLQLFHRLALKRIGAGSTTPALRLEGRVLGDSYQIADWANQQRDASKRPLRNWSSQDIETSTLHKWGETFAVWSRVVAYDWFLPHRKLLTRYNNRGAPRWQGWLLKIGYNRATDFVRRLYAINEDYVQLAKDELRRAMDDLATVLVHSPYLALEGGSHHGEFFSELDLTLASFLAPLVLAPEYGIQSGSLPSIEESPQEIAEQVAEFRAHPVGQHVLAVYRKHRR